MLLNFDSDMSNHHSRRESSRNVQLANSKPEQDSRIMIAMVGVTGAGKTTFASLASGTREPMAIEFMLDSRQIVLIDTPGFDDDMRSDLVILEDIAKWMAKKGYLKNHLLDGLIFLHPVMLNRVGGSERNRTRLLQAILGKDAYSRVIIATTFWGSIKSEEEINRWLDGRKSVGGVWHEMIQHGAKVMKHSNDAMSAHNIIGEIIKITDENGKLEPLLRKELKNHKGRVIKTSAGKELERQVMKDIVSLDRKLEEHEKDRPPDSDGRDKDLEVREKYKIWHRDKQMMEDRLQRRKKQLKKLGSLVIRIKTFLASIFG
ncbi:hypothetical protein B0H67DRAFT_586468 [Lasiosphaeris hirsuta]|uniref:G domain-containing protein n=1 Tax=Lasiosphaeris hirsuta TaxID=260670 RepID=A0AA40AA14_9PEZI|nr:hypothetical protein B0H67DRAFT_586468 [Lasiosphaeris hirsuta]